MARDRDIYAAIPSMTGKFELEYEGELRGAENIARELIRSAISRTFTLMHTQYFTGANMQPVIHWFELGGELKLPAIASSSEVMAATKDNSGPLRYLSVLEVEPEWTTPESQPAPPNSSLKAPWRTNASTAAKSAVISPRTEDFRAARPARTFGPRAAPSVQLNALKERVPGKAVGAHEIHQVFKIRSQRRRRHRSAGIDEPLSDFLLQCGFESHFGIYEMDSERSREQMMDDLREAILRALQEGDLLPPELMEQMPHNPDLSQNENLRDL